MVVPALSILIGQMVVALYNRRFGFRFAGLPPGRVAAVVLIIGYIANQAGADGHQLWKHRTNDFAGFCREVRRVVPPGARLWANLGFWIGLHDYPYRSQLSSFDDVLRFRPEYVLLYDADIWGGSSATLGREVPPDEWNRVVARNMEQLCRQRGTLVRRVPDEFYGNIEIYRLDWDP
jgi:hypothetical protein